MRNNRRKFRIYTIIILLLGIGIGYATLRTTLNIDGTADIKGHTWDVYIDEESVEELNGSTQMLSNVTISDTNISFQIHPGEPGDYYCVKFDLVNDGTLDAMVESSTLEVESSIPTQNPFDFLRFDVSYLSGADIYAKDIIRKESQVPIKICIYYLNPERLSIDSIPQGNQFITVRGRTKVVQADSTAQEVRREACRYTTDLLSDGDTMPFALSRSIGPYFDILDGYYSNTKIDRVALKHIVDDSKIISTSLIIKKDNQEYTFQPGASLVSDLEDVFGEENCDAEEIGSVDYYVCHDGDFRVFTMDNDNTIAAGWPVAGGTFLELERGCALGYNSGTNETLSVCNE